MSEFWLGYFCGFIVWPFTKWLARSKKRDLFGEEDLSGTKYPGGKEVEQEIKYEKEGTIRTEGQDNYLGEEK